MSETTEDTESGATTESTGRSTTKKTFAALLVLVVLGAVIKRARTTRASTTETDE